MPSLHPALSGCPLGLILSVAALELTNAVRPSPLLRGAVRVNLVLTAGAVLAAFLSGYAALGQFDGQPAQAVETHHNFGRLLLFLMAPCVGLGLVHEGASHNPQLFRAGYYFFLALCCGLVLYTGYLGGLLVFKHGVGVLGAG